MPGEDPTLICSRGGEELERLDIRGETTESIHELLAERITRTVPEDKVFEFRLNYVDDVEKLMEILDEKLNSYGVAAEDMCETCITITDVRGEPVEPELDEGEPTWAFESKRYPLTFYYDSTATTTPAPKPSKKRKGGKKKDTSEL